MADLAIAIAVVMAPAVPRIRLRLPVPVASRRARSLAWRKFLERKNMPPHQVMLTVLASGNDVELYLTFDEPLRVTPDAAPSGSSVPRRL